MTVYVESNFVLEHSLQQEECDRCAGLIDFASKSHISLVVPAFSLAEPYVAISSKEKARTRLGNDLRHHLLELGRSKPHREVPTTFETLATTLIASAQFERDGLRNTVSRLLQTAEIIALDAVILRSASEIQEEFGMAGQDAIVLASVLAHLDLHNPSESCFLNRNRKDFDDPDIRARLENYGCVFFGSFEAGFQYVTSRIQST